MIIEIIIGSVVGAGLFGTGAYWWTKRKEQIEDDVEEEMMEDSTAIPPKAGIKLERQLRNAIFETERNIKLCNQELEKMYATQLELLKDIGKVSHIYVEDKPLFFEWSNRLEGEIRYFYQRDLKEGVEPTILQKTQKVVQNYQAEIDLYLSKRVLFERIIQSHHENLNRLEGVNQQDAQLDKLERYQKELDNRLDKTIRVEEQALRSRHLLENIQAELEHQEAYFKEYLKLNERFEANQNAEAAKDLKNKIDNIIGRLD
ncbi:MAG: hypothetical protein MK212_19180 [Saprospiraceae bacterium]|nr:hypothetical protein [Saprospiraceae bacterium]